LQRSVIILAGRSSKGSNEDSALLELEGKPIIDYIVAAVKRFAEEVIIVTNSQKAADNYSRIVLSEVKFAVNQKDSESTLAQALTGFEAAQGEYSLVLPSGSPFVSMEIVSLLFELCVSKAAVIPRWTNQEIEALHAVYNTQQALEASKAALAEGEVEMEAMVEKLRGVRYLSTMVIEQLDPEFKSFFIVKGLADLKKVLATRKPKPQKTRKKKR
jgi:molybdopterin-guanine dinucleotide biosynthesis protein A